MQRVWMAVMAVVLTVAGERADAQTYRFFGCDGDRSCHDVSFTLGDRKAPGSSLRETFLSARSTFYESAAFLTTGCGSAWRFDGFTSRELSSMFGCDALHGVNSACWAESIEPGDYVRSWCQGGYGWMPVEFEFNDFDFGAQDMILNLVYQAEPTTLRELRVSLVPTPSVAALLPLGVLALVARGRRRGRVVA